MFILTAGLQPRQRVLYRISRKKLQAVLHISDQTRPDIGRKEIVRVLLMVDRGARHQEFIERSTAKELAKWAARHADSWDDNDEGDSVFEMIAVGII